MNAGSDQAYSTLEAVPRGYQPGSRDKPLPSDAGKQVVPDYGKQQVVYNGIEVAAKEYYTQDTSSLPLPSRLSRRKRSIYGMALGLILIMAVVLGGVFGSRHKHKPLITSFTPKTQHNIAAVSFASSSVNNTRVYYQDDMGRIIEAATSTNNATWANNPIGCSGKNSSALAAAVSRPGSLLVKEISVFYLDSNNLIHDVIYNSSTDSWNAGTISGQGYSTMPNSSLSAMYNQCQFCANTTIVAFQDSNGFVQVANLTSSGWILTQVNLNPHLGTGLALQPFYLAGLEDQINLYHQKRDLNLSLASWKPAAKNNGVYGWSVNEQIYYAVPPGTPIAAASAYSNVSSGFESWIEVLSLSDSGIEVDTWSGEINDWLQHDAHPSAMANSTRNGTIYGSVAVTAIGNAFAVVTENQSDTIQSWQVANDLIDWGSVGTVDIGSAWG